MKIIPLKKWFENFERPLIIAGPCSAESRNQVFKTAEEISKLEKVSVFRAGIWKPRTRPNSFEGVGEIGLKWLKEVKEKTNLLISTEVATPKHIEICLKNPRIIDIFWIGARTTSSPFSVQELANSLRGVDIPVMVKNPINPDLDLWIGALERFNKVGINKLAAIHRGFYPFEKTNLRNIPKWEIMIELKRKFFNMPIINDSSHISGKRKFIFEISQKALDLNVDGLMIESHINPEKAMSDPKQQLKPFELEILLKKLKIRKSFEENEIFKNEMEKNRKKIDFVDAQLLDLLMQRMEIVKEIGFYKKKNKLTILQLKRWIKIIKTRTENAKKLGMSENFVKKILELIHKESILYQEKIMKN